MLVAAANPAMVAVVVVVAAAAVAGVAVVASDVLVAVGMADAADNAARLVVAPGC